MATLSYCIEVNEGYLDEYERVTNLVHREVEFKASGQLQRGRCQLATISVIRSGARGELYDAGLYPGAGDAFVNL